MTKLYSKKDEIVDLLSTLETRQGLIDSYFEYRPEQEELETIVDYEPTPTAERFHNSPAYFSLLRGPIGCGKTYACCRHLLNIMCSIPPSHKPGFEGVRLSRILVARNTRDELVNTTLKTFFEAFPQNHKGSLIPYKWSASDMTFTTEFDLPEKTKVKCEILFRAFEDPASLRRLDGLEITAFFANECRSLSEDVFKRAVSRVSRYPGTNHIPRESIRRYVIADTNSFPKTHWLYPLFYQRTVEDKNYETFDYPSALSPDAENLERLAPTYYEDLVQQYDSAYVKAFVENEFVSANEGKRCYPHFARSKNVMDRPANRIKNLFLGLDLGRDAASVLVQEIAPGGRFHIVDEYLTFDMPLNESLMEMFEYYCNRYPRRTGWRWEIGGVDPGVWVGNQNDNLTPMDYVNAAVQRWGVCRVQPATTNSPDIRIRTVDSYFGTMHPDGEPKLTIHKDCKAVIDACEQYHYSRVSSFAGNDFTKYSEKPAKTPESHIAEAVQYALLRPASGGSKVARETYYENARTAGEKTNKPVFYQPKQNVLV